MSRKIIQNKKKGRAGESEQVQYRKKNVAEQAQYKKKGHTEQVQHSRKDLDEPINCKNNADAEQVVHDSLHYDGISSFNPKGDPITLEEACVSKYMEHIHIFLSYLIPENHYLSYCNIC